MLGLKHILGVVIDSVTFQYGQELVFECAILVMLFLLSDVLRHGWYLRLTDRKGSVTSLPFESSAGLLFIVYPFGRVTLDVFQHFRYGNRRAEACQDVDVIFNAAKLDQVHLLSANDTADV